MMMLSQMVSLSLWNLGLIDIPMSCLHSFDFAEFNIDVFLWFINDDSEKKPAE